MSGRKRGALIYNGSFSHREGNHIYPDNNDKTYETGNCAKQHNMGNIFAQFQANFLKIERAARISKEL